LVVEPGARHVPVTRHGVLGNAQDAGYLLVVQTAEVSQFNYLTATWIDLGETLERFVETNHFGSESGRDGRGLFERDLLRTAATFCVGMTPSVIDQNAAHDLCGDSEEVRAVGPMNVFLIDETNVSLIDERGGLKRVTLSFPAHVTAGKPVEFVVDQRVQLVECGLIPIAPLSE
jgi:hypothetical protein